MNNILLDSHMLLWAVTANPQLGKAAARLIQTTPGVFVSALSLFELKIKEAAGTLKLPAELELAVIQEGFIVLDFSSKQLRDYRIFHAGNRDPFDNALLAIAEAQRFRFLTNDTAILPLQNTYHWIVNGS